MSKYSLREILCTEQGIVNNLACTRIICQGLYALLFPDDLQVLIQKSHLCIKSKEYLFGGISASQRYFWFRCFFSEVVAFTQNALSSHKTCCCCTHWSAVFGEWYRGYLVSFQPFATKKSKLAILFSYLIYLTQGGNLHD